MKTTLQAFFVLMIFAISNFFLSLKILFLAFSFFAVLLFPSPQVAWVGNNKIAKNDDTQINHERWKTDKFLTILKISKKFQNFILSITLILQKPKMLYESPRR